MLPLHTPTLPFPRCKEVAEDQVRHCTHPSPRERLTWTQHKRQMPIERATAMIQQKRLIFSLAFAKGQSGLTRFTLDLRDTARVA